eukprot:Awhi_evm1s5446
MEVPGGLGNWRGRGKFQGNRGILYDRNDKTCYHCGTKFHYTLKRTVLTKEKLKGKTKVDYFLCCNLDKKLKNEMVNVSSIKRYIQGRYTSGKNNNATDHYEQAIEAPLQKINDCLVFCIETAPLGSVIQTGEDSKSSVVLNYNEFNINYVTRESKWVLTPAKKEVGSGRVNNMSTRTVEYLPPPLCSHQLYSRLDYDTEARSEQMGVNPSKERSGFRKSEQYVDSNRRVSTTSTLFTYGTS